MDITDNLKNFFIELKYNKITARNVAEKLNISYKTLSNYINGERYIPLEHLNSLSNLFNISIDYLLGLNKEKNYPNSKNLINLNPIFIGTKIRFFRKEKKLTQTKFAESIDTNIASLSRYEKGKNLILTLNLYLLAKKYQISADYLLGKIDYIPDWCNKNFKKSQSTLDS